MLPGEPDLPEAIVAPDGQAVNRLFHWLCQRADARLASEFQAALRQLQLDWFTRQRGALRCPDCGGQHLIRKGWRSRVVTTSRGKLTVTVIQVCCKVCGRTFRPLNIALGLPTSLRLLEELAAKAAFLGTQVSFARAADILRGLTQGVVSGEGVRRIVAQRAASVRLPRPQPGQTVLVDATKVKAGHKERGESVYLAVTAEPGPVKQGRLTCRKRLVHLHVGTATKLKQRLKAAGATHVVPAVNRLLAVLPESAYRLRLDADGDIEWVGQENGAEVVYRTEPHSGFWRRFQVGVLRLLQIEGQL